MEINIHAITTTFGLSQSEAEIFEHLLQYGSIKAVDLRKNLHLDRAPYYRTLSVLESKNLITISGPLRQQKVQLQEIQAIQQTLQTKKSEIKLAEQSLASFQANVKELRDARYRRDNVEVFSGDNAYLKSMQAIVRGGGKLLRDITPDSGLLYKMAGSQTIYESIVKQIKAERLKKKITIQILFDNQAKIIDSHSATSPDDLKESRQFGGNLKLDCYLNTCGSKSLFYTKDASGSWGIVIKDPLITNLLNSLFDVIWNLSKPL